MSVYIELLFLDNLLMNALIIFLSSRLQDRPPSIIRNLVASSVGAVYALLYFLSPVNSVWGWFIVKVLFAVAMVAIANNPKSFKALGGGLVYFLLSSCILGGVMLGLFYLTGSGTTSALGVIVTRGIPLRIVLIGGVCGCIALEYLRRNISMKVHVDACSAEINVVTDKGQAKLKALVDTGNGLTEPLSGRPVILVKQGYIEILKPKNAKERMVPCVTISGFKMLKAFKAKHVFVYNGDEERKTDNVYVAVVENEQLAYEVDAIIGPTL